MSLGRVPTPPRAPSAQGSEKLGPGQRVNLFIPPSPISALRDCGGDHRRTLASCVDPWPRRQEANT